VTKVGLLDIPALFSINNMINKSVQKYLLKLARISIESELGLESKKIVQVDDPILNEKRGVFVTLEMMGQLRGCIGNIMPVESLENSVKENAANAAFHDPRFAALKEDELKSIEIEISVLTVPKRLVFSDTDDLLKKLRPNIDGVVLSNGLNKATYLPQVWEKVANKEDFLRSLCQKAGLGSDAWKDPETIIETYQVELFKESDFKKTS